MAYVIIQDYSSSIGSFATAEEARSKCAELAAAAAAVNPNWTVQNTSDVFACVNTKRTCSNVLGIECENTSQTIIRTWQITKLQQP